MNDSEHRHELIPAINYESPGGYECRRCGTLLVPYDASAPALAAENARLRGALVTAAAEIERASYVWCAGHSADETWKESQAVLAKARAALAGKDMVQ
jgi:hypothetical protein